MEVDRARLLQETSHGPKAGSWQWGNVRPTFHKQQTVELSSVLAFLSKRSAIEYKMIGKDLLSNRKMTFQELWFLCFPRELGGESQTWRKSSNSGRSLAVSLTHGSEGLNNVEFQTSPYGEKGVSQPPVVSGVKAEKKQIVPLLDKTVYQMSECYQRETKA